MNAFPNFFVRNFPSGIPIYNGLNGINIGIPVQNGMNVMSNPSEIFQNFINTVPQGHSNLQVPVNQTNEMSSLSQSHRRKLLRRVANRNAAKLLRARKKTYHEELKVENLRLQKFADMLDYMPDLLFCVNQEGKINYISERTRRHVKSDDTFEEDPSHMNQILTNESMHILIESLNQSKEDDGKYNSNVSQVKEICYHDANGYPTVGYLRCTKIVNKQPLEKYVDSDSESSSSQKEAKKPRITSEKDSSTSSTCKTDNNSSSVASVDSNGRNRKEKCNKNTKNEKLINIPDQEDEYVCVIRPADSSIPEGSYHIFQTYLSTASMVEHDRQTDPNNLCTQIKAIMNNTASNRGINPNASLFNDSGSEDKFNSSEGYNSDLGSGVSSDNQVSTVMSSELS